MSTGSSTPAKAGGVKVSFKLGPKTKVVLFLVSLWAVQAFYVYSVDGVLLTPTVWFGWWTDRISGVIRWLDAFWTSRSEAGAS